MPLAADVTDPNRQLGIKKISRGISPSCLDARERERERQRQRQTNREREREREKVSALSPVNHKGLHLG